jgi:hypothetical protein
MPRSGCGRGRGSGSDDPATLEPVDARGEARRTVVGSGKEQTSAQQLQVQAR